MLWDPEILDYRVNLANQTSGPITAGGKASRGGAATRGGPHSCAITAHDAATGEELWRRRLIPEPGEPGKRDVGRGAVRTRRAR